MTAGRLPLLPVAAVIALFLSICGTLADPLPQGGTAPGAPDQSVSSDTAQPTPVMDQHDVPAPSAAPPVSSETQKPPADTTVVLPKNVEPVTPAQAFSVLGKKVHGPDGKDVIGSISDILVDDQGHPRAAIVDFGGFLGVGSRKIAVDWQLMKFHATNTTADIILDIDRSQIQAAPEYKDPTQPAEVVEPPVAGASPPSAPPATPLNAAAQPDAEKHPN